MTTYDFVLNNDHYELKNESRLLKFAAWIFRALLILFAAWIAISIVEFLFKVLIVILATWLCFKAVEILFSRIQEHYFGFSAQSGNLSA